jgi:hypothetical protein
MKKNLVFASKKHQTLPFRIAGLLFWSKRLTGEEELLMSETDAAAEKPFELLERQAGHLAQLLQSRLQEENSTVDQDWTLTHLGTANTLALVQFFRTGVRPADFIGESFDLPEWGDALALGAGEEERQFSTRAACFSEQIAMSQSAPEDVDGEDVETGVMVKAITETAAAWLSARLTSGEPIDAAWLLRQLQIAEIGELLTYLASGKLPDEEEEADPNVDVAAPISA